MQWWLWEPGSANVGQVYLWVWGWLSHNQIHRNIFFFVVFSAALSSFQLSATHKKWMLSGLLFPYHIAEGKLQMHFWMSAQIQIWDSSLTKPLGPHLCPVSGWWFLGHDQSVLIPSFSISSLSITGSLGVKMPFPEHRASWFLPGRVSGTVITLLFLRKRNCDIWSCGNRIFVLFKFSIWAWKWLWLTLPQRGALLWGGSRSHTHSAALGVLGDPSWMNLPSLSQPRQHHLSIGFVMVVKV